MIAIDDFGKVEMRVGLVEEAINAEGSEKLIRLKVNFGEEMRVIFTGVRKWYEAEFFVGKKFVFVTNLEFRKMMGEESQGMILASEGESGVPVFVQAGEGALPGDKVM